MSSLITSILSSIVDLLWNKLQDTKANKLKDDGEFTDAQMPARVVRELNDINSKIYAISRKHQLISNRFLKESVDLLIVALDEAKDDEKAVLNDGRQAECDEELNLLSCSDANGILTSALEHFHVAGKLKIITDKEFVKGARKKATEAFCNEALSIKDRIGAARLRVVSEILEWLDSPKTAITGCMSFLQELHNLPAIREIFSVYLNGGLKWIFDRAEREENVKSVMLINYVLFQFVLKFSMNYASVLTWPTIEIGERNFNPIYDWREVLTTSSWGEKLFQPPNKLTINEIIYPYLSAVNSHGEIVARNSYNDVIKVISRRGECMVLQLPDPEKGEVFWKEIVGLAVDNNNNVYVVRFLNTRTDDMNVKCYVLYVLDENYNIKYDAILDFLDADDNEDIILYVNIAINRNNDIIMMKFKDPQVYVCDNTGNLKHKFERESGYQWALDITYKNEVLMASVDGKAINRYMEKGELNSTIKPPEGHVVWSFAFHHIIGKIVVLTYVPEKYSSFLQCYSDTGELENSTFFSEERYFIRKCMTSHPSGPAAVVGEKSITFL